MGVHRGRGRMVANSEVSVYLSGVKSTSFLSNKECANGKNGTNSTSGNLCRTRLSTRVQLDRRLLGLAIR